VVFRPVRSVSTSWGVPVQPVAQSPATQVWPPSVEPSISAASQVAREGPPATISPPIVTSVGDEPRFKALEASIASMAETLKLIVARDAPGHSVPVA